MNQKLLCMTVALLWTAPVFADNCSGTYMNDGAAMDQPIDVGDGRKLTFFKNTGTVGSTDTPYNGKGGCTGYVIEMAGGGGIAHATCVRFAENGDRWGYTSENKLGEQRGKWTATDGTGQFAKNAGSTGWWENADDQGTNGKWGGNCNL